MAPLLLPSAQFFQLQQKLEAFGDKTLQIKALIQMTIKGYTFGKFEVWVDAWPNFNALLIKWDWTNTPVSHSKYYYYEFSLSDESFKRILEEPGIVQLEKAEFGAIREERRATLEMFAKEHGYHLDCNGKWYELFYVTEDNLVNTPTPKDLNVGSLTSEWTEMVTQKWDLTEMDKFDSFKEFTKLLIDTYPSVCLYDSKNQPIAYAIGQEYGGIGMLYVDPVYRGRGCAKAIMSMLSEKYLSENIVPFIIVDIENIPSVSLNTKLGYKSTRSRIFYFTTFPDTLEK